MLCGRISKKKLCAKINCIQATANYLCQFTRDLNNSIISLNNSIVAIESNVDILEKTVGVPISKTTTISSPGNYVLQEDITGCIIIDANDVTLDLNNRTITGTCNPVIKVNDGALNAVIKNGNIVGDNQNNDGIGIETDAHGCTVYGVNIENCDAGITVNTADLALIEHCIIKNCDAYGIDFIDSSTSEVKYCQVLDIDTTSAFAAYRAYYTNGGGNITFFNCIAKNITSTSGIYVFSFPSSNSTNLVVDNCIIEKISNNFNALYGITFSAQRVRITNNYISDLDSTVSIFGISSNLPDLSIEEKFYAHNNFLVNFTTTSECYGIKINDNDPCYISGNFFGNFYSPFLIMAIERGGTSNNSLIGNMSIGNGPGPFNPVGTGSDIIP